MFLFASKTLKVTCVLCFAGSNSALQTIGAQTEGFSGSDLMELCSQVCVLCACVALCVHLCTCMMYVHESNVLR